MLYFKIYTGRFERMWPYFFIKIAPIQCPLKLRSKLEYNAYDHIFYWEIQGRDASHTISQRPMPLWLFESCKWYDQKNILKFYESDIEKESKQLNIGFGKLPKRLKIYEREVIVAQYNSTPKQPLKVVHSPHA